MLWNNSLKSLRILPGTTDRTVPQNGCWSSHNTNAGFSTPTVTHRENRGHYVAGRCTNISWATFLFCLQLWTTFIPCLHCLHGGSQTCAGLSKAGRKEVILKCFKLWEVLRSVNEKHDCMWTLRMNSKGWPFFHWWDCGKTGSHFVLPSWQFREFL